MGKSRKNGSDACWFYGENIKFDKKTTDFSVVFENYFIAFQRLRMRRNSLKFSKILLGLSNLLIRRLMSSMRNLEFWGFCAWIFSANFAVQVLILECKFYQSFREKSLLDDLLWREAFDEATHFVSVLRMFKFLTTTNIHRNYSYKNEDKIIINIFYKKSNENIKSSKLLLFF